MTRTRIVEGTGHPADQRLHEVRILVLATFASSSTCTPHCTPGPAGFLLKGTPPPDLIAVVRLVAKLTAGVGIVRTTKEPWRCSFGLRIEGWGAVDLGIAAFGLLLQNRRMRCGMPRRHALGYTAVTVVALTVPPNS